MADKIFIEGIKFHGYHGLTKMEREVGVRLSVDVTVERSLEKSGRSDNVRHTLDYRKVHQRVMAIGKGTKHKLLESFAHTLLKDLFERFPADSITVTVRKETPVLDGIVDSVGVAMKRSREEMSGSC